MQLAAIAGQGLGYQQPSTPTPYEAGGYTPSQTTRAGYTGYPRPPTEQNMNFPQPWSPAEQAHFMGWPGNPPGVVPNPATEAAQAQAAHAHAAQAARAQATEAAQAQAAHAQAAHHAAQQVAQHAALVAHAQAAHAKTNDRRASLMKVRNATLRAGGLNAMMPDMMTPMRRVPDPQPARPSAYENSTPDMDENPFDNDTTLMLRNLPNKLTQRRLVDRLEAYRYAIDFLYLPTDFKNKCNLGYAFINFSMGSAAAKFFKEFDGTRMLGFRRSQKVLAVQPARIQGLS